MKPQKPILILAALIVFKFCVIAQYNNNLRIGNIDFNFVDEKIKITYQILNVLSDDRFYVWIEPFSKDGQKIPASSFIGDVNNVRGNKSKIVYWDIKKDNLLPEDVIYLKINAKYIPNVQSGKALYSSLLYPGLGDYQVRKNAPYWLYGVLGYGLIGASVAANMLGVKSYDKYKNSQTVEKANILYNESRQYQYLSYAFAGGAALVWTFDLTGVMRKNSKIKHIPPKETRDNSHFQLITGTSQTKKILR